MEGGNTLLKIGKTRRNGKNAKNNTISTIYLIGILWTRL